MKKIKTFIIAELTLILIKTLGGVITGSFTMITSAIYDITLITIMLLAHKPKENNKSKCIITSLLGFLFTILALGIIFIRTINQTYKTSFWVIFFLIISIIIRYLINCIYTNTSYQRKKGLLSLSLITSNLDFYNYGVILGALIIYKFHKILPILKYADLLGTILISLIIIYKGFKISANSFKILENNQLNIEIQQEEITNCPEVKKVKKIDTTLYGGIKKITCELTLKDNISMIDLNSFAVTLQDYLLKKCDISEIELVETKKIIKKKPKVRSLKQDARNSRSGNSKTNTKKKNPKKKNKKR